MKTKLLFLIFIILCNIYVNQIYAQSVSQNGKYPKFCMLAANNDFMFRSFRSNPEYRAIVETCGSQEHAKYFTKEILAKYPNLLSYCERICLEDKFGEPLSFHCPGIGLISPTVLRYIKVVGDLQREFGDLSKFNIGEIGGGFGGQCKIIDNIAGFASYTIYDLPEVTPLVNKYLAHFDIKNFKTINCNDIKQDEQFDLVISNYAFSEIDRLHQLHYITMVIGCAPRGYIIYNHFPAVNPFSLEEFIRILESKNKNVKIISENPQHIGDIIIWNS